MRIKYHAKHATPPALISDLDQVWKETSRKLVKLCQLSVIYISKSYIYQISNHSYSQSTNPSNCDIVIYFYLDSLKIHCIHKGSLNDVFIVTYSRKLRFFTRPWRKVTMVKWRLNRPSRSKWGGSLKIKLNQILWTIINCQMSVCLSTSLALWVITSKY